MPAVFPFSQCVAAPLGQGLTGLARQAKQHLALLGAFCFSLSLCLKTFFVFHFCIIFISGVRISFFSPILVNIVEISLLHGALCMFMLTNKKRGCLG